MRRTRMRRFQIYLDPSTDLYLQHLADRTGKAKAELIRDGINLLLVQETAKSGDPLLDLVGLAGEAGCPDAAERHDDYLSEVTPKRGKKP